MFTQTCGGKNDKCVSNKDLKRRKSVTSGASHLFLVASGSCSFPFVHHWSTVYGCNKYVCQVAKHPPRPLCHLHHWTYKSARKYDMTTTFILFLYHCLASCFDPKSVKNDLEFSLDGSFLHTVLSKISIKVTSNKVLTKQMRSMGWQ